jgi:8-amino-7-oxononanoate synthase
VRLEDWLGEQAREREQAGLVRSLSPRSPRPRLLDLAGNDYLGLSTDPRVTRAAATAALTWGAGAGSSRLVTGTLALHEELERELAAFCRQPKALAYSTGYHANLGLVSALADRETVIVSDAHVHASLVDACRLSRSRVTVAPHNDVRAVARALDGRPVSRALVLVESVYSVLGDTAPLDELAEVCGRLQAVLVVDEAHALGVAGNHGSGLVAQAGLADSPHVIVTATLSKSLGSQGGVVMGSAALVDHLVNRSRPFIYDTGLAPASTAGALAALRVLVEEPGRVTAVRDCADALASAVGVVAPAGAVLSVRLPGPAEALAAQERCARRGLRVGCFRPPSTPDASSRLRITARATLGGPELEQACSTLTEALRPAVR